MSQVRTTSLATPSSNWVAKWFLSVTLLFVWVTGLAAESNTVVIVEISPDNGAELLRTGATIWTRALPGETLTVGDRFRTKENSRATLRIADGSQVRIGELAEF